jgi:phage-related protein
LPQTEIRFYQEEDGHIPVLEWMLALRWKNREAFLQCLLRIRRLEAFGYELRRPIADGLRDGIRELRIRQGRTQVRILYFFHGRNAVVLAHALVKREWIAPAEIDRALARKHIYEARPDAHTWKGDWENA